MRCLPLWPTYIGEKGMTLVETYAIQAKCYLEHHWGTHCELREHIGNPMGTHWELEGNLEGTCWDQRKMEKILPPPTSPTQNLKEKKIKAPWVHASAYPLAACIFGFQHCSSPLLAWSNGWVSELGHSLGIRYLMLRSKLELFWDFYHDPQLVFVHSRRCMVCSNVVSFFEFLKNYWFSFFKFHTWQKLLTTWRFNISKNKDLETSL
jgi:hypothetical protein